MLISTLPQTKPRIRRREIKDMVAIVRTRTKVKIRTREVTSGHMEMAPTLWRTPTQATSERKTIPEDSKVSSRLLSRYWESRVLVTPGMESVGTH